MFTSSAYKQLSEQYKQQLALLAAESDLKISILEKFLSESITIVKRANNRILDLEAENAKLRITYENAAALDFDGKYKFYKVT